MMKKYCWLQNPYALLSAFKFGFIWLKSTGYKIILSVYLNLGHGALFATGESRFSGTMPQHEARRGGRRASSLMRRSENGLIAYEHSARLGGTLHNFRASKSFAT